MFHCQLLCIYHSSKSNFAQVTHVKNVHFSKLVNKNNLKSLQSRYNYILAQYELLVLAYQNLIYSIPPLNIMVKAKIQILEEGKEKSRYCWRGHFFLFSHKCYFFFFYILTECKVFSKTKLLQHIFMVNQGNEIVVRGENRQTWIFTSTLRA